MGQKFKRASLLTLFVVLCLSVTISAASKEQAVEKKVTHYKQKIEKFAGGDDEQQAGATSFSTKPISQSSKSASSVSPGVPVGNTWYDYQHNGTIGRMIDWGNDPSSSTPGASKIYFGWMDLPGAALAERNYSYNVFISELGILGGPTDLQPSDEYAGYVNVQSTNDGRLVIGGHNNQGAGNQVHMYWPPLGFGWWNDSRIPDSVAAYGATSHAVIWPKFAYQEGTDTVTHVIAQVSSASAGDPQSIYYFRKVGANELGVWDYPPYIVDTIYTLSHDITASRISDKVAMTWTANLAYDPATTDGTMNASCDTCSDTSPFSVQWDNDIYYQTSDDQGVTWNPRVNATKAQYGEVGFRAYTDLSCLIDSNDDLHILWSAIPWAADISNTFLDSQSRLFHYSENVPFVRTVANAEWATSLPNGDATFECGPGGWNIFISKMQISECDGKLYAMWVQFQDLPNGITDDCAARAATEYSGSANGELYLSVSSDGGATWDASRNLTNSRTPGCDPNGGFGDCESDNWASMVEYGRQNIVGEDWLGADIVDPSGLYAGDYFLDIQYVHDRDPGGITKNEGTWQLSNINWFRLACVEPIPAPEITISPNNIAAPTWTKMGIELPLDLKVENNGNVALTYSTTIEEDNGAAGWLAVSGLSGAVPSGLSNVEVGTLHLNNGAVQNTEALLIGRVIFNSNAPSSPDTLEVSLYVVDTIVSSWPPDTVQGYLSLSVNNAGNYGNSGDNRINLDFVTNGADCDSTATVYLYDASPIILQVNGSDTTVASSIFDNSWLSPNGFKPQGGDVNGVEASYNWYTTGMFVSPDTTIALEQTFYAPTAAGANYIIKKLKVWSYDGLAHTGLRIGDAIDWDIPSDSGGWNYAGFDASRNLIYQIGAEFDQDDTLPDGSVNPLGDDCVDADRRFGGMAYLGSFLNGSEHIGIPYSAYTARNDSFIFPQGNFLAGELWKNMDATGYSIDAKVEDQHMVMCYDPGLNLGATDTLEYWVALVTVQSGTSRDIETAADNARSFAGTLPFPFPDPGCCIGDRGNVDGGPDDGTFPGSMNIGDLVYMVAYMFQGGPAPPCLEEADCNGDGDIDIADLVCMVSFMFQFGLPPLPCP